MTLEQAIESAAREIEAGRLEQGEAICRQILSQYHDVPDALHLLGLVFHYRQQHQAAVDLIDRAIAIKPMVADFHANRGAILLALGRLDETIESSLRALHLMPDCIEALEHVAKALLDQRRYREAIPSLQRYTQLKPDSAIAYALLADAHWRIGQFTESIAAYRDAARIDPQFTTAWHNLGMALQKSGQPDEAMECFIRSEQLEPALSVSVHAQAEVLKDTGRLDEAMERFRKALTVNPNDHVAHSGMLFAMHFWTQCTPQSLKKELAEFDRRHTQALTTAATPHTNSRDPDKKLRIGYVSPDFYSHTLSFFNIPLFESHDHNRFEIHCYANTVTPDHITDRFRKAADHWHDVLHVSDADLAAQIRRDGIDILIDLTMHMQHNRAMVFARKPAPVQAAWIAYPGSTGMAAIDYRISDPYLDPPGMDETIYSERTLRLPHCFWCYDPFTDEPSVMPPPSADGKAITFGCLNNFCKINPDILRIWARILAHLPESQLLILCDHGTHRQKLFDALSNLGISPQRVELIARTPRRQYLELYHRIDITLDTFPYNGHTTTMDSIWMGVPVVSLAGERIVARGGLSILSNVGLSELVAQSEDQYVQLALELANDPKRLLDLRLSMRERMRASPLMDAHGFARNMERLFRRMWQRWCE